MKRPFLVVSIVCVACGGPDASSPSRPLVPYDAHQQQLFDDAIDPIAVGINLDENGPDPRTDAVLRERAQTADGVVRARVETVTMKKEEREGHKVTFELGLKVIDKLAGRLPDTLVVRLGKTSPSAGIVESMGAQLADKTFVVFARTFDGPNGKPRYYAHFASDSKDVIGAVKDASAP